MIAAIVGSRDGLPWTSVKREITKLLESGHVSHVVSGGALGVDRLAESLALACGLRVTIYRPDWQQFGRSAGFRRNVQIVDFADEIFAFWNGESRGTANTIDIARKKRKPVYVWQRGTWS